MISEHAGGLTEIAHDVCIVGSGPAGIALALELAARNKRVLLLESGGRAKSDVADELSAAQIVDERVHDDARICVSRRLGGTSNLWGARCQPFDPIDFTVRPWLPEAAWPAGMYEEIAPWYPRAAELISCGEPEFEDTALRRLSSDPRIDVTRIERFSTQPKMQITHGDALEHSANIDVRLNCTVVDAETHESGRIAKLIVCTPDGHRHAVPVRTVVFAMGGLETTRLLLAMQRNTPALFGGPSGALGRYYMAHVIGEVSDIVFRTEAIDAAFDFFLDGKGSYARRRLIPSDEMQLQYQLPNVSFWPVVPPVADSRHGSALLSTVFLAMAIGPIGRLLMAESIRRYHAPAGTPWGPHLANIAKGVPSAIAGSARFLRQRYFSTPKIPGFFIRNPNRTYGLSYHAEHFPNADSRITLADDNDRFGLPKLRVDLRFSAHDASALFRTHEVLREWLSTNDLGELRYRQQKDDTPAAIIACAKHGTHQIGTTRMSDSAKSGIVNTNLQTFDIANLYLASSAVFPSSSQANPTLTIVALAARLAKHLTDEARLGR